MKTIILFEFDGAYASRKMNTGDKYKRVRVSGERFLINHRTAHLFDELVKTVFNHLDEMSIAFVANRTIADRVFTEVTTLEDVHLPVIRIESEEQRNETLDRLAKNVDRIVWVGPNAQIDKIYDCQVAEITTLYEMTHESWLVLTESLKF